MGCVEASSSAVPVCVLNISDVLSRVSVGLPARIGRARAESGLAFDEDGEPNTGGEACVLAAWRDDTLFWCCGAAELTPASCCGLAGKACICDEVGGDGGNRTEVAGDVGITASLKESASERRKKMPLDWDRCDAS